MSCGQFGSTGPVYWVGPLGSTGLSQNRSTLLTPVSFSLLLPDVAIPFSSGRCAAAAPHRSGRCRPAPAPLPPSLTSPCLSLLFPLLDAFPGVSNRARHGTLTLAWFCFGRRCDSPPPRPCCVTSSSTTSSLGPGSSTSSWATDRKSVV